ncbi:MAG: hypothetical protein LIP01_11550 [Tannerellaceae bacterium]|nr:hypothetical protein [Tannerellaceae bacterium]
MDKTRKIQDEDLFLEYEMMEDMSVYTDDGIRPSGNHYCCIACFTDNGGRNSEIYIRLLSDTWWKDGKEWEEPVDTEWRYVGYLDEIPTFQHLFDAYQTFRSGLE